MELPKSGLHGFRTIFRKLGRLSREDKAKLYHLLVPNPVMILGDKAAYDALPEEKKVAFDAFTVDTWLIGMEEVLIVLEALIAEKTVKVVRDQDGEEPGNHGKSHSRENTGIHPPEKK